MDKIPVDRECMALAAHFLQDVDGSCQADIAALAEELQEACEAFFHALEVDDGAAG